MGATVNGCFFHAISCSGGKRNAISHPPMREPMLSTATLPKDAKALPAEAQRVFLDAYNADFGWRCSEGHAEKAAWRQVKGRWPDLGPQE